MKYKIVFYIFTTLAMLMLLGCVNEEKTSKQDGVKLNSDNSKTPPGLIISVGENTFGTVRGTYSWNYSNGDGTSTGINSDSAAPPYLVKDYQAIDVVSNNEVKLDFQKPPIDYQVRVWSPENNIVASYNEVDLTKHKGRVIYEVLATWEQGTVTYSFVLNIKE